MIDTNEPNILNAFKVVSFLLLWRKTKREKPKAHQPHDLLCRERRDILPFPQGRFPRPPLIHRDHLRSSFKSPYGLSVLFAETNLLALVFPIGDYTTELPKKVHMLLTSRPKGLRK